MSGTTAPGLMPAGNKKAARNAANEGGNASNQGIRSIDSITAPKAEARLFTKQQKRRGPTPSQFDASSLTEGNRIKLTEELPTGRRRYTKRLPGQQPKSGPPSLFDAFIHCRMMHLYVHSVTNPLAIGRTAH